MTSASMSTKAPPRPEGIGEAAQPSLETFAGRLQAKMDERGVRNYRQLAHQAGLGDTAIYDLINGRVKNPGMKRAKALAQVLECDLDWLLGVNQPIPVVAGKLIPVVGAAVTGLFRAKRTMSSNGRQRQISGPFHPDYPNARIFALEVGDEAMKPMLSPGNLAVCLDMVDAGLSVEHGKLYAIRREVPDRDDVLCETTIRRAHLFEGHTELRTETTNGHTPISVTGRLTPNVEEPVHAIGLVFATVALFV